MGDLTKNFSRYEFACRCGCGFDDISPELVAELQVVRDEINLPIKVNSGCRCPAHNKASRGERNSFHLKGRAADVRVPGMRIYDFYRILLLHKRFGGVGYYPGKGFVHVDDRPKRYTWAR